MRYLTLFAAGVAVTVAGCGPVEKPVVKHPVSGTVKTGDKPLAAGTLIFDPASPDQAGGAASAPIKNGAFTTEVPEGKFTMRIATGTFGDGTGSAAASSDARTKETNEIPPKYKTGVPVEITGPKTDLNIDLRK